MNNQQKEREINIPYIENIYESLKKYLDSIEDEHKRKYLFKAIKSYFFHPDDHNLDQFFNCGKKNSVTPNRNRLERIRQLSFGLGIPWEIFNKNLRKEHFITDQSPEISSLQKFERLSFYGKRHEETDEFVSRYVGALGPYIKESKEMIWVYEYLGKGRTHSPGTAIPHYAKAHKIIFEMYENQLKLCPSLKYKRLLALPLPDIFPPLKLDTEELIQQKAGEALIECSLETYEHICRCFKFYQEQAKFYIVRRPPQIYHYAIYDDKYTISEYYRYNSEGDFLPDLLFVEKVAEDELNSSRKLYNVYFQEIRALVESRPLKTQEIKITDFIEATQRGEREIINKIKDSSQLPDSDIKQRELETWKSKKETMGLKIKTLDMFFPNEFLHKR